MVTQRFEKQDTCAVRFTTISSYQADANLNKKNITAGTRAWKINKKSLYHYHQELP